MKVRQAYILLESARDQNERGLGTTLIVAHRIGKRMFVVQAENSHRQLVRDQKTRQLTADRPLTFQFVERGG